MNMSIIIFMFIIDDQMDLNIFMVLYSYEHLFILFISNADKGGYCIKHILNTYVTTASSYTSYKR